MFKIYDIAENTNKRLDDNCSLSPHDDMGIAQGNLADDGDGCCMAYESFSMRLDKNELN